MADTNRIITQTLSDTDGVATLDVGGMTIPIRVMETSADYRRSAEYGLEFNARVMTSEDCSHFKYRGPFEIKKVVFNEPATIVLWEDGTKTVVKAQDEEFDPEKGLAMAISKKALGNKGNYCNEIKKWTEPYEEEMAELAALLEFFRVKEPDPVQQAYNILVETGNKKGVLKSELYIAMEEAVGYLGEALDD